MKLTHQQQKVRLMLLADGAEAKRIRLGWPYHMGIAVVSGISGVCVTVATHDRSPFSAVLPLAEAEGLLTALTESINILKGGGNPTPGQREADRAGDKGEGDEVA
jgi:hypothetical protein